MHSADEYRELFTWLSERLGRLVGDAEDFETMVLESMEEEETSHSGCAFAVRSGGLAEMRSLVAGMKEHIASIEGDMAELSRLGLEDRIESEAMDRFRRVAENREE